MSKLIRVFVTAALCAALLSCGGAGGGGGVNGAGTIDPLPYMAINSGDASVLNYRDSSSLIVMKRFDHMDSSMGKNVVKEVYYTTETDGGDPVSATPGDVMYWETTEEYNDRYRWETCGGGADTTHMKISSSVPMGKPMVFGDETVTFVKYVPDLVVPSLNSTPREAVMVKTEEGAEVRYFWLAKGIGEVLYTRTDSSEDTGDNVIRELIYFKSGKSGSSAGARPAWFTSGFEFAMPSGCPESGTSSSFSVFKTFLQYRNSETTGDNRFVGFMDLRKEGGLIDGTEVETMTLRAPAGEVIFSGAPSAFTQSQFYNYLSETGELSPLNGYSGYACVFPEDTEMAQGRYFFNLTFPDGSTLAGHARFPGKEELPYVSSSTMNYEWLLDGSLRLTWENPTGEFDSLTIALADEGKERLYVNDAKGKTEVDIPKSAVDVMMALFTGPGPIQWRMQTRKSRTDDGMNYARGISGMVEIAPQ